ncbi:MAG TPA: VOC family protein [Acidimicrobiales bacterium]
MTTSPRAAAPITGLSHVQLLVSDVGASAAWYSLALGLETYVEDLDIGYVALRHRAARLVVVLTAGPDVVPPDHESQGARRDGQGEPSGRLDHLAFAVSDGHTLRTWADHLTEVGIDHAGVVLENGNPSLQLRDPDGVAIELVAPSEMPAPGTLATGALPRPTPK